MLELVRLLLQCRSSGTLPVELNARIDEVVRVMLEILQKGVKDE